MIWHGFDDIIVFIRGGFMEFLSIDTFDFVNCLLLWAVLLLIFTLIELFTYEFFALCFSFGSVSALVASLFDVNIVVQVVVFLTVSGLLIVFIRPIAYKLLKVTHSPTNADMLIGKEGVVIEKINNLEQSGRVNVFGQNWAARNITNMQLEVDSKIIVKRIEGVTLIVESKK